MPYYAAGYAVTYNEVFDLATHLNKKPYKHEEFTDALEYLYDDLLNKYGVDIHDLEDTVEPTILIVCIVSDSPIPTSDLVNDKTATSIRSYLKRADIYPCKSHTASWQCYPG